ncbi:MAG: pantoate--beta-alanine ligase [Phycisphaerae bacterium]|jgi:pantoate--beta-alanine ligase
MEIARTIAEARAAVVAARARGARVGFVPTMGALHAGHLSLVERARLDGGYVVVSIFVNPLQFGPGEDYERYPRDEPRDRRLCEESHVDLLFLPSSDEIYPSAAKITVRVRELSDTLCGPHRPGHFDGVATVVAKLFNIVQPDRAYFGEKDAQQLAIIRRMVVDLNFPLEIVGVPTVREADGLAMSSRNAYLSGDERRQARSLYVALSAARELVRGGERDVARIVAAMTRIVQDAGPVQIDYISVVDPETLSPLERIDAPALIALAVRIGRTRLIDNLRLDPANGGD